MRTATRPSSAKPPGGRRPMLATPGPLPTGKEWAYELKWDGIRAIVTIGSAGVRIETRSGNDITPRFPEFADLHTLAPPAALPLVLDGEIVAFGSEGYPDFHLLQSRIGLTGHSRIASAAADTPAHLILFDVIVFAGAVTTELPYHERRNRLQGLKPLGDHVSIPRAYSDGQHLLESAVQLGIEGVVAKRLDSPYRPDHRSRDWIKVKRKPRQEFAVGGWTPGGGHRKSWFGSLLLGYRRQAGDPGLRFAGAVGSGFGDSELAVIAARLDATETDESPFCEPVNVAGARFVDPTLVAEVEFQKLTPDGRLRHPVFKGLRSDKRADEVVLEDPTL
ncbi:MAG: hypothetical protein HZB14_00460 [Actinobacteria bacterium]|nr:hypothetical protein [Actinomycetota bacterium]